MNDRELNISSEVFHLPASIRYAPHTLMIIEGRKFLWMCKQSKSIHIMESGVLDQYYSIKLPYDQGQPSLYSCFGGIRMLELKWSDDKSKPNKYYTIEILKFRDPLQKKQTFLLNQIEYTVPKGVNQMFILVPALRKAEKKAMKPQSQEKEMSLSSNIQLF